MSNFTLNLFLLSQSLYYTAAASSTFNDRRRVLFFTDDSLHPSSVTVNTDVKYEQSGFLAVDVEMFSLPIGHSL